MELGGGGWSWVEVDARFSNNQKKSKNKHHFVLPALIQINQENTSSTFNAIGVDFISLKTEGKEAKSPVVSKKSLQCGKAMTFENCHILLRTLMSIFYQDLSYFTKVLGLESGLGFRM